MKLPPVRWKTVLITGCSSGIGRATAEHLRARDWRVLATARRAEDVDHLRKDGFEAWRLDVGDAGSVSETTTRILDHVNGELGALVNNAGFGQHGAMEDISRETLRRQFEVNVFGLQDLTNRILPVLRKAGSGRIVQVSSVLGRLSLPMAGSYCASKHAVEALADAQRIEVRRDGIGIILVEPGPIATEFHQNAARSIDQGLELERASYRSYYEGKAASAARRQQTPFSLPPSAVARVIEKALTARRPAARYTVTLPARIAPFLRYWIPESWLDAFMARRLPSRS